MKKQRGGLLQIAPQYLHGTINPNIVKELKIGGTSLKYVAAPDIISMLNHVYRDRWDFTITDTRRDDLADFDILFTVTGRMHIPHLATKMMSASTSFVTNCVRSGGKGKRLSELDPKLVIYDKIPDLYKIATTDCMKKLASWFHIAESVYGFTGTPLFINAKAILTEAQKTKLRALADELGEPEDLQGLLWQWDPRVRNLMALDSTIADEFIQFIEDQGCKGRAEEGK